MYNSLLTEVIQKRQAIQKRIQEEWGKKFSKMSNRSVSKYAVAAKVFSKLILQNFCLINPMKHIVLAN